MPLTVLLTGANRGLGLEFAKQLAARGDHVIAAVRSTHKLPSDLIGAAKEIIPLDVSDPATIDAVASRLHGRPLDMLINNAGIAGVDKTIASMSSPVFERVLKTNTIGPALLTRAVLPNLRAGTKPKVLNISSTLGSIQQAMPGFSYAYCVSKAALNMVTALMAKDLKLDGITVVSFCPGWNKTDMGGEEAPLEAVDSIRSLLNIADRLTITDSGRFLSHEGNRIPF